METVKCAHCGKDIPKSDAIPCAWEKYDLIWYYCKRCNDNCYKGGFKNYNGKDIPKLDAIPGRKL